MWAAGGRRRRAHDDSCVPEPWPSRGATPRSLSVPRGCCGFPCAPAALPGLAGTVSSRTSKPRRQRRAEARLATAAQRSCVYGARAVGDAAPVGNEKGQIVTQVETLSMSMSRTNQARNRFVPHFAPLFFYEKLPPESVHSHGSHGSHGLRAKEHPHGLRAKEHPHVPG